MPILAVDSPTLLDVAPVAISAISLLVGGVLGGGGYMAWRISRAQIAEERANYWKREKQNAYARALKASFGIEGCANSILVHLHVGKDYEELAVSYDEDFDELVETRSVIELLAPAETLQAVNDYMNSAQLFWLTVTSNDTSEARTIWKETESLAVAMQDRFRIDLGLSPVLSDD